MEILILAAAAAATEAGAGAQSNPNTVVWLALIAMVGTAIQNYFSQRKMKASATKAEEHAAETVATVAHISKSVNSEREVMIAKLDKLERVIIDMTKEKVEMMTQRAATAEAVPNPIKALILDDDPSFLDLVKQWLEKETVNKFEVEILTDPKTAPSVFMERRHHVYLVDFRLAKQGEPEVSGLDFIRGLRGAAHMGPFILLSAHIDDELIKRALNEGVQMVRDKQGVIRGTIVQDILYAIQSFRTAQRAKQ